MPFLSISGYGNIDVLVAGATEDEGEYVGEAKRSFSGAMRSSRRLHKARHRFTAGPITESSYQSLRTVVEATGGIIPCSGDAIASASYLVTIGNADYIRDASEANDFRRTVQLTLDEV